MRITQIELHNIKSYRHAVIPLREGTTAIRGQNGAGKSTLVEAIGFALFDSMSYNQAQFVREGEKWGQVAISFLSALDDREYTAVRRCGSSPAWYIHDAELGSRVVEQRADVIAFLRQHLRIEGEVELSALFSDALGVTQGTFTADFLLTAAQRKKKFDTLLQVEDYRKAAEKLNDTRTYLQQQRHEQDLRIAELERETAQLPAWRVELAERRSEATALAARLAAIQREAAEIETRRDALRRQEAEVTRLASAAELARATLAAAEAAEAQAAARHDEARAAQEICAATHADSATYLTTEAALSDARERERARNELLARRGDAAQRLEGLTRDRVHAQSRLAEATAAAQRVVELQPAVERQHDLETRLREARLRADSFEEQSQRLATLQRERAQVERALAEMSQRIAALEPLRAEAAEASARRARLEAMQAAEAARAQREQRQRAIVAERAETTTQRELAIADEAKLRADIAKLRANQPIADELPARETVFQEADAEVRRIEAQQEHHRLSRQQSGQGQCPFLREPCLNIQRRGENSLASYFDRLIEEGERALVPARERRETAARALQQAQTVRTYCDRLPDYEERHAGAARQITLLDQRLARLAEEEAALARGLAEAPDAAALAAARNAARRAEEADRRLAALPTLHEQRTMQSARLEQLTGDRTALEARLAALAAAREEAERLAQDLAALDDPRARSAAAAQIARERPQLEAALAEAEARAQRLEAALAQLDAALAPYAELDATLRALEATLASARDGHTRYLQHQQIAARLPEREAALAESRQNRQNALAAYERGRQVYEAARAGFDPDLLTRLDAEAAALGDERGQKTADLKHTQDAAATLEGAIARVERLEREELAAVRAERQTLDDLEKMLQHFRETIKEAGPYIMRALLRQISVEANRIFGEILGDRSAQLSWEQDYEIVLRRDGRERSFALLSGGEQMSAALAVRLALLRSLSRLDIAFFDEPTQNMDGLRRGNLAEQIRRIRGFEQLLVISHDDTFEQGLDSVIYLEKRNGETVLADAEALIAV